MKKILTLLKIIGIGLLFLQASDSKAQFPGCNLTMSAIPQAGNSMTYNLSAYLYGDSICGIWNPQYTWTVYGNPSVTYTGQFVTHTFNSSGYFMICVQATFGGMVRSACDTIVVQSGMNCNLSFNYTSQGLSATFLPVFNNPSCFNSSTIFYWNFGDSSNTTSMGNSYTAHNYSAPGTYQVCLITTAANGQTFTYCNTITVSISQNPFYLGGMVLANNFCLNEPVMVELYGLGNSLYQSQTLNGMADSCYYYFQLPFSAQPNQYLIRATPLQSNNYLPTYYGNVLFWNEATTVFSGQGGGQWGLNINLISAQTDSIPAIGMISGNITGNGTLVSTIVNGNIITSTFNTSACRVILYNSANQPIGFAPVNASGNYSFSNLPPGNYSLKIDHPLIPSNPVAFSIAPSNASINMNFTAGTTGLLNVTKVQNLQSGQALHLSPNPASDYIQANLEELNISIMDACGKQVWKQSSISGKIPLNTFRSGMYMLQAEDKSGRIFTSRFVKE